MICGAVQVRFEPEHYRLFEGRRGAQVQFQFGVGQEQYTRTGREFKFSSSLTTSNFVGEASFSSVRGRRRLVTIHKGEEVQVQFEFRDACFLVGRCGGGAGGQLIMDQFEE